MKLSPRTAHILFVTIMVSIMSMVISLVMTLRVHSPLADVFFSAWIRSWAIAIVVAWPTAYLSVPLARSIVSKLSR